MWHQLLGTWKVVETEKYQELCFREYENTTATNCLLSYKEGGTIYSYVQTKGILFIRKLLVLICILLLISYTTLWRVADRRVL